MMRWLNRNVGPEGCAGCLLLLALLVIGTAAFAFGLFVVGPILVRVFGL